MLIRRKEREIKQISISGKRKRSKYRLIIHTITANTKHLFNSVAPYLCLPRPWLLGTLVLTDASVPQVLHSPSTPIPPTRQSIWVIMSRQYGVFVCPYFRRWEGVDGGVWISIDYPGYHDQRERACKDILSAAKGRGCGATYHTNWECMTFIHVIRCMSGMMKCMLLLSIIFTTNWNIDHVCYISCLKGVAKGISILHFILRTIIMAGEC